MTGTTIDRNGVTVQQGTKVRVLVVPDSMVTPLPLDDVRRIRSMLGEVFEVYEVDPTGQAWVEKWWRAESGESISHSVGLAPSAMEVVTGRNDEPVRIFVCEA